MTTQIQAAIRSGALYLSIITKWKYVRTLAFKWSTIYKTSFFSIADFRERSILADYQDKPATYEQKKLDIQHNGSERVYSIRAHYRIVNIQL